MEFILIPAALLVLLKVPHLYHRKNLVGGQLLGDWYYMPI
jgi:hypothetical protein